MSLDAGTQAVHLVVRTPYSLNTRGELLASLATSSSLCLHLARVMFFTR